MTKKLLIASLLLLSIKTHSQLKYDRVFGSVINTVSQIGDVKATTDEFYYADSSNRQIKIANSKNSNTTVFYTFPATIPAPTLTYNNMDIADVKFDNSGNLIVYGRTHNANLGQGNVYSNVTIPNYLTAYTFIAKISATGNLVWLTYFHDLLQQKNNLAIDANNNIYVLTVRPKTEVLSPSYFQGTADLNATSNYQEVISKLNSSGNHLWSTFYFNEGSRIQSIQAGNDGLYVYGDHLGATATSKYFGTPNSHQEYATGYGSANNDNSNVFLSKFDFNGSRIWSTYFGKEVAKTTLPYNIYPRNLAVIGNDAYILTTHKNRTTNNTFNVATSPIYISQPTNNEFNYTLTKFSSNGSKAWTTYLHTANNVYKTMQNEIMVTGDIENTYTNLNSMTTTEAYQTNHGGKKDIYTAIFPSDGRSLKFGSLYGFAGNEQAYSIPTNKGFYIIGTSSDNTSSSTNLSSNNEQFIERNQSGYYGNILAYFELKNLSIRNGINSLTFSIFPNPTTNLLHLETKEELNDLTELKVYDINGRLIIATTAKNPNQNTINVSTLSPGIYFLKINSTIYNETIKFIKK